ncbi:MAG: endonuclease NucS [Candidatus Bathyarchaeia archaeon]
MYRITLYIHSKGAYISRIQGLKRILEEIFERWMVEYRIFDGENLTAEEVEDLRSKIRNIPPQVRGRIVTSRNYLLPLSRSKELNLLNTPIVLLERDSKPVDVYPHLLGARYRGVEDSLNSILRYGPDQYLEARGIIEDPLIRIISDCPEAIEEGLTLLEVNVGTPTGVIDVLLRDRSGRVVVVEVETMARDRSAAQVCRLAAGYSSSSSIPIENVRKMIVCLRYDGGLRETCRGSGVELYRLDFRKV